MFIIIIIRLHHREIECLFLSLPTSRQYSLPIFNGKAEHTSKGLYIYISLLGQTQRARVLGQRIKDEGLAIKMRRELVDTVFIRKNLKHRL